MERGVLKGPQTFVILYLFKWLLAKLAVLKKKNVALLRNILIDLRSIHPWMNIYEPAGFITGVVFRRGRVNGTWDTSTDFLHSLRKN